MAEQYVLRPAKVAPSNSPDSVPPVTGVLRDVKDVPASSDFTLQPVEVAADQYRAAFIDGQDGTEEFLIFAANDSNLAIIEDDTWAVETGTGRIPTGSFAVLDVNSPDSGQRQDGSQRLVIVDNGDRSIARILSITGVRGDDITQTPVTLTLNTDFLVVSPLSGVLTLIDNATTQALLQPAPGNPPAFSNLRGDVIRTVSYVLAEQRWWWTKNDDVQRFGWRNNTQRWEPFKGSSPVNLGELLPGQVYQLSPRPTGIVEGGFLPGSPAGDAYSMIRVGTVPDANSIPIAEDPSGTFNGMLVTSNDGVTTFNFSSQSPPPAAVIGITSGLIRWNPSFVEINAGLPIWYSFRDFQEDSTGEVGQLLSAKTNPLFLSPVPQPLERPFVRLGSRTPLETILVPTEADLLSLPPLIEGQVAVAVSTGRLRFSDVDLDKSDPDDVNFDPRFLGAPVIYDGLSLTQVPQPVRPAVVATDASGSPTTIAQANPLFIPDAVPLFGLGQSGILNVPDGTGSLPTSGGGSLRPGGDDPSGTYTGLIRQVGAFGDVIAFTRLGAFSTLVVVDEVADFPRDVPAGEVRVAREDLGGRSQIQLGSADRRFQTGEILYYRQAILTPSRYIEVAELISRKRDLFTLAGTEVFYFAIDGLVQTWPASSLGAGIFTTSQVAASINAALTTGAASERSGFLVLSANDINNGTVEIGFGDTERDLSGAAVLGFLPGWRVDTADTTTRWLPDNGSSLGLFRSSTNKDRQDPTPDYRAFSHFEDEVLVPSIQPSPFVTVTNPPLRDIAGYDEDVFFRLQAGPFSQDLVEFQDVIYGFNLNPIRRFSWIAQHTEVQEIPTPTQFLNLQRNNLIAASFLEQLGGGLVVAEGGAGFVRQEINQDFLLDQDGVTGAVQLITSVGDSKASGFRGTFLQGSTTFTDLTADFVTDGVQPGWQLKLTSGDGQGQNYIVERVTSPATLEVSPAFAVGSGTTPVSWQLFEGVDRDSNNVDPGLVADLIYERFNHLPKEPLRVRLLTSSGPVPASESAQESSRLLVEATEALEAGRPVLFRFTLDGPSTAVLSLLSDTLLGTIANASLFVPGPGSDRFTDEAFSIVVGTQRFVHGTDLIPVATFTVPAPATGTVEYLTTTGELAFAADLLTSFELADVVYREEFLTASLLPQGTVEVSPETGGMNISGADITSFAGQDIYFVEQMITEDQQDVTLNPIDGSFAFLKPLKEGQIVEVNFFRATTSGAQLLDEDGHPVEVTRRLSVSVSRELAVRVSSQVYSFNSAGKTIDPLVEVVVYRGVERQNYGSIETVFVDIEQSEARFTTLVADDEVVLVTYRVLEAFGGETAFSVPRTDRPIFRPPFFLEAGQTEFVLDSDRTADVVPGKLLRLGARPLYIKSSVYDSSSDQTTVTTFPPLELEVGSRSPGQDVVSLLSSEAVTTIVDGTATPGASPGYFVLVGVPFENVRKNLREIRFRGDVTRFARVNHILEVGGVPNLIIDVELADDGYTTTVQVSAPFIREFVSGTDLVRLSTRPIFDQGELNLTGLSPVILDDDLELVLFEEGQPGVVLIQGTDYNLNPTDGGIQLLEASQDGIQSGDRFFLRYTAPRVLAPTPFLGVLLRPRFRADFSHLDTPSVDNNLLGQEVRATYTFSNPDSIFYEVTPLVEYLPDVIQDRLASIQAQNPTGGALVTTAAPTENRDFGAFGTKSDIRDLLDQDRGGRFFLSFYNDTIQAFEQIVEAVTGRIVGDRDGKFRFFVGRDRRFAPPGYEDEITGDLNPRNVWSQLFLSLTSDQTFPIRTLTTDPVVEPLTAVLSGGGVTGQALDPTRLAQFIEEQRALIRNDIDDIVLTGTGRALLALVGLPPRLGYSVPGVFQAMFESHPLSRVYPQRTRAFTTTVPGIGATLDAPGVYSAGTSVTRPDGTVEVVSTNGQAIGTLSNPTLEVITNIQDATVRRRQPQAQVVSYNPTGVPDLDPTTAGRPTFVLSQVPLIDFPVDVNTGLPDPGRLRSQSLAADAVIDIQTGDAALSIPPFVNQAPGPFLDNNPQQLALGKPDGRILDVRFAGEEVSPGVFQAVIVDQVSFGCLVTLRAGDNLVTQANELILVSGDGEVTAFESEPGDTLFGVPFGALPPFSDPPTADEIARAVTVQGSYRVGVDVNIDRATGDLIDISLPSVLDPSSPGWREWIGQNPPSPLSDLEAVVSFLNTEERPVEFPALEGEALADPGDRPIPFLNVTGTETVLLREAFRTGRLLLADTPQPLAAFPAEIFGTDGAVSGGELTTSVDLTPVATAGSYTPNSGIGDVRPYDVLLVQTGQLLTPGAMGILSVGQVASGNLNPPRFVTQTRPGDRIRYRLTNAMAHLGGGATGVVVREGGGTTTLDFSSSGVILNDGQPGDEGGLNSILNNAGLPFPNENRIIIDIYDPISGADLGAIEILGDPSGVLGPAGAVVISGAGAFLDPSQITFDVDTLVLPFVGVFTPLGGPYDFTITVDTNTPLSSSAFTGSYTGAILNDRITFSEVYSLVNALGRGTTNPNSESFEAALSIETVTGPSSEDLTVNGILETNAAQSFTFTRPGSFSAASVSGAGDESASIEVNGFEGQGNVELTNAGPFIFSVLASADQDTAGDICQGTALAGDASFPNLQSRLGSVNVVNGALANVNVGDLVVIESAADPAVAAFPGALATTKAGTYLIRDVIESDDTVGNPESRRVTLTSDVGIDAGWVRALFPLIEVADEVGSTLQVSDLFEFDVGGPVTSPSGHAFPASGRVFVIVNVDDVDSTDPPTFALSVVSAAYTSIDVGTRTFQGLTDFRDALNAVITASEFFALTSVGLRVSGAVYFPVNVGSEQGLFDQNTPGFDDSTSPNGLAGFRLQSGLVSTAFVADLNFDASFGEISSVLSAGLGILSILAGTVAPPEIFNPDPDFPVYSATPRLLSLANLSTGQWEALHQPAFAADSQLECLLPGEALVTALGANAGFYAQAGIFIEPSWPRPTADLNGLAERVVDITRSLTANDVGFRNVNDFTTAAAPETVAFTVRRARRFPESLSELQEALRRLRLVYEIRRGSIASYNVTGAQMGEVVASGSGTQLGGFLESGVSAGDTFRLLQNGTLVEDVEIMGVVDDLTLKLASPGLQTINPVGFSFEIYVRQAPVPHEQSNEELLALLSDTIFVSDADMPTNAGGFVEDLGVYTDSVNKLKDSRIDGVGLNNFQARGVLEGDYVIVDPAGDLDPAGAPTPAEGGQRPFGDASVVTRAGDGSYVPGEPSDFDDNRGFYRVAAVSSDLLEVDGDSDFAGDIDSGDVIIGSVGKQFAFLPTVTSSTLAGGPEGQNDLRPTAYAVAGSFDGNPRSVAPFSYKIVRRDSLIRQDTFEFVLFLRERTLSLIELVREQASGEGGGYFTFQIEAQIEDLLRTQLSLVAVLGQIGFAPFANNAEALSVLDRRFWVGDTDLDIEAPIGAVGPPFYAELGVGEGRPVLDDYVERALDLSDKLREFRRSWLDFRAVISTGTLDSIRRIGDTDARQTRAQQDALSLLRSSS